MVGWLKKKGTQPKCNTHYDPSQETYWGHCDEMPNDISRTGQEYLWFGGYRYRGGWSVSNGLLTYTYAPDGSLDTECPDYYTGDARFTVSEYKNIKIQNIEALTYNKEKQYIGKAPFNWGKDKSGNYYMNIVFGMIENAAEVEYIRFCFTIECTHRKGGWVKLHFEHCNGQFLGNHGAHRVTMKKQGTKCIMYMGYDIKRSQMRGHRKTCTWRILGGQAECKPDDKTKIMYF